jgi:ADP-heptose:LPS heptosyltransferase
MDNPSVTSTFLCLFSALAGMSELQRTTTMFMISECLCFLEANSYCRSDCSIAHRRFILIPRMRIFPSDILHHTNQMTLQSGFFQRINWSQYPLIGINISAGGEARFWGIQELSCFDFIYNRKYPELRPILLYQPSDEEKANTIVDGIKNVVLSPLTKTFDQFAAMIKKLSFLISPDTSAIHLASAFSIPSCCALRTIE